MASCSFVKEGRTFTLSVEETSYSVENNTSNVKWTLSITGGQGYWNDSYAKATVNGQVVYNETKSWSTGQFPAKDGSVSGTINGIEHDSQGEKTIPFSVEGYSFEYTVKSASGSLALTSIPRYFTTTPTLEITSKTETSLTIKWTTSENASKSRYKIGNGSWVNVESNIDKSTGSITINNLQAGTNYTIYVDLMRKDSELWCQTPPSIQETTYNYPYVSSTPNFTIGNNFTIGIYNPLNRNCTIYLVGADNSQDSGKTTTGTSVTGYNTTTYENFLYNSIPNTNSATYKVRLVCGALNRDTTVNGGTYSTNTAQCSPQFTSFNVKDNNSNIVAVTGSDQVFVKGYSTLQVIIPSANKMVAQKGATPNKYVCTCDTLSQNANYSSSDVTINMGTIINNGALRVNTRAYDSRTNNTLAYKDITVYDYAKPVINAVATRLNNFENQTTLQISGTYNKLTINSVNKNTITNVKYRYRETNGTWSNWTNLSATLNNGAFTCNNVILSLDNSKSFEFEISVTDNIDTTTLSTSVAIGKAIFFISTNNRECYINGNKVVHNDDNGNVTLATESINLTTGNINLTAGNVNAVGINGGTTIKDGNTNLRTLKELNTQVTTNTTDIGNKAPTSHASSGTGYGVGTTNNYGHCKSINDLTHTSYSNGECLSAYQGYLLKLLGINSADLTKAKGYVKFENGFIIQWVNKDFTTPVNSSWGSLYESGYINIGQWAVTFKEAPTTTLDIQSSNGVFPQGHQGVTVTECGTVWLTRATASNSLTGTICCIGFGKWK